jgi:DNA-binding NtrC family response regulator
MTSPSASSLEPTAVLVVDDDAPLHPVYSRVVERAGGQAFLASNGKEVHALLGERDFAAVLLDKNLPDISGVEILKWIKQRQPRTEVIMVTGYASLESAVQALRLGAFDYVEKPFDINVLGDRLKEALARRRRLTADVAQNAQGPLGRLADELAVVAEVVSRAAERLRATAETSGQVALAAPISEVEQAVVTLREAADSARQIAQVLTATGAA